MYAQLIDDVQGKTIMTVSDLSSELKEKFAEMKKKEKAYALGKEVASQCQEKGIEQIVFDRNGFIYHGRVKALAEGAREGGLKF
jgi:large subunit ribosomal protein L18